MSIPYCKHNFAELFDELHRSNNWQILVDPLHGEASPVLDLVASAAIANQPCNSTPFVFKGPQLNLKKKWSLFRCQQVFAQLPC